MLDVCKIESRGGAHSRYVHLMERDKPCALTIVRSVHRDEPCDIEHLGQSFVQSNVEPCEIAPDNPSLNAKMSLARLCPDNRSFVR